MTVRRTRAMRGGMMTRATRRRSTRAQGRLRTMRKRGMTKRRTRTKSRSMMKTTRTSSRWTKLSRKSPLRYIHGNII